MIDKAVFAAEMTILRDRFGRRDMTAETIARYLDHLDPQLTTAQFQAAARQIFNHDTFWPSPARFLEALHGDPKAASEEAWNTLLTAATRGDGQAVTPEALTTLRALGITFRDVMTANDIQLNQIGKRFRAAHERAANPTPTPPALEHQTPELEFLT